MKALFEHPDQIWFDWMNSEEAAIGYVDEVVDGSGRLLELPGAASGMQTCEGDEPDELAGLRHISNFIRP